MPPAVIDVRAAEDVRDVIHRAVQSIAEGQLIVFPTETVYGIAARALDAQAVERLLEVKGRRAGHPLTLAVKSADEARDYAPNMSRLARRFARRCWPGPVTLVVDDSHPESLIRRLPPMVGEAVSPGNTVGLRVPGHQIILDVLHLVAGPLALSSANRGGQPDAATAREAIDALGDSIDLVLDDGPSRYGQPSSVVRVSGAKYDILRAGVVPQQTIARLAAQMVLFVCTGNTCRSPMAEVLFRQRVADRLGCGLQEIEDRGVIVMSAGVASLTGGGASREAIQAMAARGLDLTAHATQPVTDALVQYADHLFTMTNSHREAIVAQWPQAADRVQVLCADGADVTDPIGGAPEFYQQCAAQIDAELERCLDRLDLDAVN